MSSEYPSHFWRIFRVFCVSPPGPHLIPSSYHHHGALNPLSHSHFGYVCIPSSSLAMAVPIILSSYPLMSNSMAPPLSSWSLPVIIWSIPGLSLPYLIIPTISTLVCHRLSRLCGQDTSMMFLGFLLWRLVPRWHLLDPVQPMYLAAPISDRWSNCLWEAGRRVALAES